MQQNMGQYNYGMQQPYYNMQQNTGQYNYNMQQPYYNQVYANNNNKFSSDQIKNLIIGGILILVHLLVILNLTYFCESNGITRKIVTYIYGWLVAAGAIMITLGTIGIIAFALSFVPFPITMTIASIVSTFIPIGFAIISLIIGSFATDRTAAISYELRDIKCENKDKSKATQTATIALLIGFGFVFIGFKPIKL